MCSFAVNDEGAWRKKPGSAPRGVRQAECEGCGWVDKRKRGLVCWEEADCLFRNRLGFPVRLFGCFCSALGTHKWGTTQRDAYKI